MNTESTWYRPAFPGSPTTCSAWYCADAATWANQRQTEAMAAPGFYYYCEKHGNEAQQREAQERVERKREARVNIEPLSAKGSRLEARALRDQAERLLARADAYERRAQKLEG